MGCGGVCMYVCMGRGCEDGTGIEVAGRKWGVRVLAMDGYWMQFLYNSDSGFCVEIRVITWKTGFPP